MSTTEFLYINETTTGCAPCPYYFNGKCTFNKKCTHILTYTTNTETSDIEIYPVIYFDDTVIYYNNA